MKFYLYVRTIFFFNFIFECCQRNNILVSSCVPFIFKVMKFINLFIPLFTLLYLVLICSCALVAAWNYYGPIYTC